MAGFFYAYASEAGAKISRPGWFDGDGNLSPGRVLISTRGVIVTPSVKDENGDVTVEAVISDPYVILSASDDGPEGKRIDPHGRQGFA